MNLFPLSEMPGYSKTLSLYVGISFGICLSAFFQQSCFCQLSCIQVFSVMLTLIGMSQYFYLRDFCFLFDKSLSLPSDGDNAL